MTLESFLMRQDIWQGCCTRPRSHAASKIMPDSTIATMRIHENPREWILIFWWCPTRHRRRRTGSNIPVCDGMACKRAHYLPRSPRDNRVRNRIIDHVRAKGGEGRVYTDNGWRERERLVRNFSNILYNAFLVRSSQRNEIGRAHV